MGRKGNWFNAVKQALHSESKEKSTQEHGKSKEKNTKEHGKSKEKNTQEHGKSKKKWFRKKKRSDPKSSKPIETNPSLTPAPPLSAVPTVVAPSEPAKSSEADKEQSKQAYNATLAPPKAKEVSPPEPPKLSESVKGQTKQAQNVAVETPKASDAAISAVEVVRMSLTASHIPSKSKEELAAITIQNAFRGYMARRTLLALRGLMRLNTVMQGQTVKRQTSNTLKCMQTLARVQGQILERRLKMAEENHARQRKIQQNYDKDRAKVLEKSQQNGDGWDSSGKTKKQIEVELQSKHEAAIRRERTLAYAYTHQQPWKANSRLASTLYMDPNNSHWGWSWLERWLAARPWETATTPDKEFSNENSPRTKGSESSIARIGTTKLFALNHTAEKPSSSSIPKRPRSANGHVSTSSAPSKPSTPTARKLRSPSPKASPMASPRASMGGLNDDTKSMLSMQSEQSRRNSGAGSSVGDDESLASSITIPSYMAPTHSAKAKSRSGSETKREKSVTPDRLSVSSAKKRLSYTPSPARSRHSTSSVPDANSISDHHT